MYGCIKQRRQLLNEEIYKQFRKLKWYTVSYSEVCRSQHPLGHPSCWPTREEKEDNEIAEEFVKTI